MFSLILWTLWSGAALAFNQDKCGELFPKIEDRHPPYFSPLYTSTMVPSSTSYLSSFGKCSMYGRLDLREQFLRVHGPSLASEGARGSGEHLEILRELTGCPESAASRFRAQVQAEYGAIFGPNDPKEQVTELDTVLGQDPELRRHCLSAAAANRL